MAARLFRTWLHQTRHKKTSTVDLRDACLDRDMKANHAAATRPVINKDGSGDRHRCDAVRLPCRGFSNRSCTHRPPGVTAAVRASRYLNSLVCWTGTHDPSTYYRSFGLSG